MAGIKEPIQDILTKLVELQFTNGDGNIVSPYVRIWNNQLNYTREGKMESFTLPALFLEVVSPATYEVIGQGFRSSDIGFNVHLVHEYYNAETTFEQDLVVFDLRDKVIALLTYFTAAGCGPLNAMHETQDYEHDNIYHYIIGFVCNFTDSKGSRLDPDSTYYTEAVPPTTLEVTKTITKGGGQVITQEFLINK